MLILIRYMRSIFAPFCTIIDARDGKEALDLCAKSAPDLIISDVMMPNVSVRRFSSRTILTVRYDSLMAAVCWPHCEHPAI